MEWVALSAELPAALVDAVAELLLEADVPAVITDAHERIRPDEPVRLEAHLPATEQVRVAAALADYLERAGAGAVRIDSASLPETDWQAVFRRHHRPVEVGRRLLVVPPWETPAAPGRIVLVIEPGMAFGTGQHATTRGCLEEIEQAIDDGTVRTALDVGTGSGVLAAALSRLGVPAVVACDVDPSVLSLARANLDQNAAAAVTLFAGGAAAVRGRFDLVVANLLADAIVTDAAALAAAVAPGGRLVLSGLLAEQTDTAVRDFAGWQVAAERAEGAWRTLRLVRAGR